MTDPVDLAGVLAGIDAPWSPRTVAVVNALAGTRGEPPRSLEQLVGQGTITYVPFPPALVGKYQSFTEADPAALRAAGYLAPMATVAEAVPAYVGALLQAGVNP